MRVTGPHFYLQRMKQSNLENIVADFVGSGGLFRPGERVVLAVSGGADSLALLYVFHSLKILVKVEWVAPRLYQIARFMKQV